MVWLVGSSVLMNQQCILNKTSLNRTGSFPGGTSGTCLQCRRHERRRFDPWVGKFPAGGAAHSSILAWRIPWTEEPDGLQFVGLQRVGHD